MRDHCSGCHYNVVNTNHNGLGTCRKRAPVTNATCAGNLPVWPMTWPEGWCGDFEKGLER